MLGAGVHHVRLRAQLVTSPDGLGQRRSNSLTSSSSTAILRLANYREEAARKRGLPANTSYMYSVDCVTMQSSLAAYAPVSIAKPCPCG